jgi:hypothetical protein
MAALSRESFARAAAQLQELTAPLRWRWQNDQLQLLDDHLLPIGGLGHPVASPLPVGVPFGAAWHRYSLAVAFHPVYHVPVLLLRGTTFDGSAPLSLEAVLRDLASFTVAAEQAAQGGDDAGPLAPRWAFLSLADGLGGDSDCGWLMLHPCGTGEAVQLMMGAAGRAAGEEGLRDWMRAWWSLVGGAVGARRGSA